MSLKEKITQFGGQALLAERLNVTQGAVSQWITNGVVPAEKVLKLESVLGVPRHEIRPDLYPPEDYAALVKRQQEAAA